jgi:hypothetical protein
MNAATASEIARLETMTITQVVERFESLFGEKCRSRNKRYLIRRIAWQLQANAEGGLSERAKAQVAEWARLRSSRDSPARDDPTKTCKDGRPISTCLGPALATPGLDASSRLQGPADPGADLQQRIRVRRPVIQVPHGARQHDHRLPRHRIPVL